MALFPKNPKFFLIYTDLAEATNTCAHLLSKISAVHKSNCSVAKNARAIEKKSDALFHTLQFEIDSTFITPFDREDMHALGKDLNDILDLIENVIADIEVYKINPTGTAYAKLAKKIANMAGEIRQMITFLEHGNKNAARIKKLIESIHTAENEADGTIREALSQLFHKKKKDPVYLLKWSHLYQNLEHIFDACEDVSDLVSEIVIKNY